MYACVSLDSVILEFTSGEFAYFFFVRVCTGKRDREKEFALQQIDWWCWHFVIFNTFSPHPYCRIIDWLTERAKLNALMLLISNFQISACCLHSQFHIKLNPLIMQELNCLRWRNACLLHHQHQRQCQHHHHHQNQTKCGVRAIILSCSLYELKFNVTVKLFGSDVHRAQCAHGR